MVKKLPIHAMIAMTTVTFTLFALFPAFTLESKIAEIPASIIPMEEDSAAKNTSNQNSNWKIFPAVPMDVNTVVIDTNSSPGPADGSRPNANTAGKIATPARTAAKESPKVMIAALDSRFSFLSR